MCSINFKVLRQLLLQFLNTVGRFYAGIKNRHQNHLKTFELEVIHKITQRSNWVGEIIKLSFYLNKKHVFILFKEIL